MVNNAHSGPRPQPPTSCDDSASGLDVAELRRLYQAAQDAHSRWLAAWHGRLTDLPLDPDPLRALVREAAGQWQFAVVTAGTALLDRLEALEAENAALRHIIRTAP